LKQNYNKKTLTNTFSQTYTKQHSNFFLTFILTIVSLTVRDSLQLHHTHLNRAVGTSTCFSDLFIKTNICEL